MDDNESTVPLEDFALDLLFKKFVSHCDNIVTSCGGIVHDMVWK